MKVAILESPLHPWKITPSLSCYLDKKRISHENFGRRYLAGIALEKGDIDYMVIHHEDINFTDIRLLRPKFPKIVYIGYSGFFEKIPPGECKNMTLRMLQQNYDRLLLEVKGYSDGRVIFDDKVLDRLFQSTDGVRK